MSNTYHGMISTVEDYIKYLYNNGFDKSRYLTDEELISLFSKIGIFKLKGYIKEIKYLEQKSIDYVLVIYLFIFLIDIFQKSYLILHQE